MPKHTNMLNATLNALEIAEIAARNARFMVDVEVQASGTAYPATIRRWERAVENVNKAHAAVRRATIHDRRH
jgi:hypothetical protein